jgi:hypothetical protein
MPEENKDESIYRNINSGTGSGELKFKDVTDFEKLHGHKQREEDESSHDDVGHDEANQLALNFLIAKLDTQLKDRKFDKS